MYIEPEAFAAGRAGAPGAAPITESPHGRHELARRWRAGERFRFVHFWGAASGADHEVGRRCLSQWSPAEFTTEGHRFPTAEHYMMWRKAVVFGDHATADRVLSASHPGEAKRLGRQVSGFDPREWERVRESVVFAGNHAKFTAHPRMRAYLAATRARVLVEASPVDTVWGIGLSADDPAAADPTRWRGDNLLGFVLMRVRAALAAE
ncbi:hypothetical protein LX16_1302 [Stackebrandtia albiflava]|uniref:NADAR domain-containing protein n=1 Tax=Stackebrandtia albiflava TaxID=406432 RepID=A0A562VCQ1_9ACTN|nr:NADAR family protein [Stackebrandtia albiflava]TWJ15591.1 hypothetical protein LX16_1302 [Stackebrandtia albiflava]